MPILQRTWSALTADPRHGQVATLGSLLIYGLAWLDFDISIVQVLVTLATALSVQWACDSWTGVRRSGFKSALISALSLCLLLRVDTSTTKVVPYLDWALSPGLIWAAVASTIAVGSKFVVRIRGKHVFNPTNGALVALLLMTDAVWVSPGQWGTGATFAFTMACAGMLVVNRATRSDVTLAFIASYAGLLVARSLWLGEPMTIPLHRLQSGAFLLFSFFMISDPKTTPDRRDGRILFAMLVVLGAAYVQFRLFRTNGLLWSLAITSPLVPLIDLILPATRYQWPTVVSQLARFPWRTRMKNISDCFARVWAYSSQLSAPSMVIWLLPKAESRKPKAES